MKSEIRHPNEDQLIDYADALLDTEASSELTEHLDTCAHCRRRVEALQQSLALSRCIWQDHLEALEDIRLPLARRFPWKRIRAVAACVLLGMGLFWASHHQMTSNDSILSAPNLEQIERDIAQATMAAKLLAAADLMTKYPDAQPLVQSQYRHIVEGYPDTFAAQDAKRLID